MRRPPESAAGPLRAPRGACPAPRPEQRESIVADDDRALQPFQVGAREAARLSGVGLRTWHRLTASARTPRPTRLSSRVLWNVEELRAWATAGCPSRERWEAMRDAGGAR